MSRIKTRIARHFATTGSAVETVTPSRSPALLGAAVIVGILILAYLPSLHGGFLLDDDILLTTAPYIKTPDGLHRIWCTTELFEYYPVAYSSFWLEWRLWGANPVGYRVTNLLLFMAASLLIWAVLRKLAIPGAFLAALLFAVHPVNVESVAWIAQRRNVLAMVFFLLSILCYLSADGQEAMRRRHEETKKGGSRSAGERRVAGRLAIWYGLSLLAFVLAMFSKGSVAILPLLLLAIAWWRNGRLTVRAVLWTAPFFPIAVALTCLNIWFQTHGPNLFVRDAGIAERLAAAGAIVWFYLSKAFLPLDLAFVYPQWSLQLRNLLWWAPAIAAIAVTAVLLRSRNYAASRSILFAWGCFCIALAPVLGFADTGFMKYSLVADHYQNIALIAVAALTGAGWAVWRRRSKEATGMLPIAAAACVVIALTAVTIKQNTLYGMPIRLYEATLDVNPDCWMIHNNLGRALADLDRTDDEIGHYRRALQIKFDLPEVHNNLAIALLKQGRIPEAIDEFMVALKLNPRLTEAHIALGDAYAQADRPSDAIEQYQQALRLDPASSEAHIHLGNLYRKSNQLQNAIQQYQDALQLNPESSDACNNLGNALKQAGQLAEAERQYRHALQLKPNYAEAHNNLGSLLASLGKISEAIEHYQQALQLKPDFVEAHFNLGNAFVKAGRPQEAVEQFQNVLRLKSDDLEAAVNLMNAYAVVGRMEEAIAAGRQALALAQSQGNIDLARQIEAWLATNHSTPENSAP